MSATLILLLLAQSLSPAERAAQARASLLKGDAATAVKLYRQLVTELPAENGLRLNLALALEAAGDYEAEFTQLQLVTKRQPDLSAALLLTGLALQKLGRPAEAVAPLKAFLTKEPANPTALTELGDAYLATGEAHNAVARFEELLRLNPRSPKALQGLGLAHTELARLAFEQLQKAPDSPERRLLEAESEIDLGRYERAFALLRPVASDVREIHEAISRIYEKTGHHDWAAAERAKPASRTLSGPLYAAVLSERQQAQAAFQALAALPESSEIHELLAEARRREGKRDEALAEWRRAAELSPHDTRLAARLAESLVANRSYEEAIGILKPLVAANPGNPEWHYQLGDALLLERETESAVPHLEAAVRLNPRLIAAQAALGRALLQVGQAAKAIPHLKAGLAADEEAVLFQLAQAYRATGQKALADQTLARQREKFQVRPKAAEAAEPVSGIMAP